MKEREIDVKLIFAMAFNQIFQFGKTFLIC